MLKIATSRKPVLEFPSISRFSGPEEVMCRMMYPVLPPTQFKHDPTGVPGVTIVKGPATPGVQIDVFVLHCPEANNAMKAVTAAVPKKRLMFFMTGVSKM
jgi:hypothetical protein